MVRRLSIVVLIVTSWFVAIGEVHGLCVKTPEANLRVGPGSNYAVGWTVSKYFPLKKLGTSLSGEWYAVEDIDGDVFWVHRRLVENRRGCAAVKSARVNVRQGPGTHYGKRFHAEKYHSFRVLKRNGTWIKVQDRDHHTGWVHRDYCHIN